MSTHFNSAKASAPVFVLAISASLLMSGCHRGQYSVAAAKGKVVCNGKPVTSGTVTFSPVDESGGKPATAAVAPDGTFVLSTESQFDGAIIGKHRVVYVAAEGKKEEDQETATPAEGSPQERMRNAELIRQRYYQKLTQPFQRNEMIVEVTEDGPNEFTIELVMNPSLATTNRRY